MVARTKNSDLDNWLLKNNMKTNDFALLVECSRTVVWKVKRGIPVCPTYAKKIYELTNGEVAPLMEKVGRRW
jgi:hypothetical protein